jgi:hypothetical protein
VLRFWNHDIAANLEGVLQEILQALEAGGRGGFGAWPPLPNPSPARGEGLLEARASSPPASGASPRTTRLPSPLAGEGLGERGASAEALGVHPSPQPLPRKG